MKATPVMYPGNIVFLKWPRQSYLLLYACRVCMYNRHQLLYALAAFCEYTHNKYTTRKVPELSMCLLLEKKYQIWRHEQRPIIRCGAGRWKRIVPKKRPDKSGRSEISDRSSTSSMGCCFWSASRWLCRYFSLDVTFRITWGSVFAFNLKFRNTMQNILQNSVRRHPLYIYCPPTRSSTQYV